MFRTLTISTEGTIQVHDWDTTQGTLPHLQRAVDGTVDLIRLDPHLDMWVNDEALYVHAPNPIATLIAHRHGFTHQIQHGPVVFTGGTDATGATLPLGEHEAQALITLAINLGAYLPVPA